MTCTTPHPHRADLRRRADRLIAALDTAPAPQTLPDIMRAARALMVIDRLLGQLWTTPAAKPGRQPVAEPANAPSATALSDDAGADDARRTPPPVPAAIPPLNRHQRRLQAARDRGARPDNDAIPIVKPAESVRRRENSMPDYDAVGPVRQPATPVLYEITA